jgi:carbon storage regulator CsrA
MIVLSRMENDGVVIANEIILKVVKIGTDEVQLGVIAPEGVTIWPHEAIKAVGQTRSSPLGRKGSSSGRA